MSEKLRWTLRISSLDSGFQRRDDRVGKIGVVVPAEPAPGWIRGNAGNEVPRTATSAAAKQSLLRS